MKSRSLYVGLYSPYLWILFSSLFLTEVSYWSEYCWHVLEIRYDSVQQVLGSDDTNYFCVKEHGSNMETNMMNDGNNFEIRWNFSSMLMTSLRCRWRPGHQLHLPLAHRWVPEQLRKRDKTLVWCGHKKYLWFILVIPCHNFQPLIRGNFR